MDSVMQWVTENYKILAAVAAGIALLYPSAGKAFAWTLSKLKGLKSTKALSSEVVDLETEDMRCVRHLRDRAAILNDEALIKVIKDVYTKLYDIHTLSTKSSINSIK